MNKQDVIKNVLTVLVVLAMVFIAYKLLVIVKEDKDLKGEPLAQDIEVVTTSRAELVSVRDIEFLSRKLEGIEVDTEVFLDKDFSSLEDYRTSVHTEPVGRSNPFTGI